MNSPQLSCCLLLVYAVSFSCAGYAQSGNPQELETYRLQLHEQVVGGKLTVKEAESLYIQKRNQMYPQAGADKSGANPPANGPVGRGAAPPGLTCQTYPDGRTECR